MSDKSIQARPDVPAGLVFFEAHEKPRQYVIFDKALIKGRQEMDVFTPSGLQLTYPFLDEEQCEIRFENGKWLYKNLSENVFSFVGGKLLPCGAEQELKDSMVIRLSNDRMLTAVFLKEFASSTDWQIINMDDGRHTVVIENEAWEEVNSALTLEYENSRWQLKDIGVTTLLLNGQPLREPTALQFDDCLQIGETRFIFEGSGMLYGVHSRQGGLSIAIDERTVKNAMKKYTLLKDIRLSIEPGNMVMILGGSGAGKSTFVNAVTGYEKAKAVITEGGLDYYKQYDQVKHRIGFVPQENLMREEDTVRMTVSNAADLRLPASMSQEEKARKVRMALETFGLAGREDTLVSKLSGGQKKRLSICTEFVASPNLFILDEPDSGLDGIMARGLMENLRLIACQGKMVLVITHAPDRVANLFDKVIVLAKGTESRIGQLAFYGGIQEARDFFGTDSLENVVKRINAVNEGGEGRADEFIEKYKAYAAERDAMDRDDFREAGAEQEEESVTDVDVSIRYKSRLGQIPISFGKHIRDHRLPGGLCYRQADVHQHGRYLLRRVCHHLRVYLERRVQFHPGCLQGARDHQAGAPGRPAHLFLPVVPHGLPGDHQPDPDDHHGRHLPDLRRVHALQERNHRQLPGGPVHYDLPDHLCRGYAGPDDLLHRAHAHDRHDCNALRTDRPAGVRQLCHPAERFRPEGLQHHHQQVGNPGHLRGIRLQQPGVDRTPDCAEHHEQPGSREPGLPDPAGPLH